jgi:hypothetical protein
MYPKDPAAVEGTDTRQQRYLAAAERGLEAQAEHDRQLLEEAEAVAGTIAAPIATDGGVVEARACGVCGERPDGRSAR